MDRKDEIRAECEAMARDVARRVGMCSWYDCAPKVLNRPEREAVMHLWSTMDGGTCWMDAFLKWFNNAE